MMIKNFSVFTYLIGHALSRVFGNMGPTGKSNSTITGVALASCNRHAQMGYDYSLHKDICNFNNNAEVKNFNL